MLGAACNGRGVHSSHGPGLWPLAGRGDRDRRGPGRDRSLKAIRRLDVGCGMRAVGLCEEHARESLGQAHAKVCA
jgi:hypothetical protein